MQARRITIEKEITINGTARAEALNLSRTGMFVLCQHAFSEGAVVELSIRMAGTTYKLLGRVERIESGLGFGVRFVDLPRKTVEFLERYVNRHTEPRWDSG